MELKHFDVSPGTGFLPEQPSHPLGDYFSEWEEAVRCLPQLIRNKLVVEHVTKLQEKEFSDKTLKSQREWQRAYVVLSYLAQAYLYESEHNLESALILPSKLSIPWQTTAEYVGLPPVAAYAAVVLYNYTVKDPKKPFTADNLSAAVTFTGSDEESWFVVVHALEELAAATGLQAIITAYNAISSRDNKILGRSLMIIEETLQKMNTTLEFMQNCTPYFFYWELRPFLGFPECGVIYSGVSPETKHYRSGSGAQDSAIPAFSIFLGIKHGKDEKETLDDLALYMPAKHREFLDTLSKQPSVRCYVQESGDAELIKCYDKAVRALESFRSEHIKLVTSYIINAKRSRGEETTEEDKGTGGTPFMQFLKNVRDNTKS